jgi:hypothetical protein
VSVAVVGVVNPGEKNTPARVRRASAASSRNRGSGIGMDVLGLNRVGMLPRRWSPAAGWAEVTGCLGMISPDGKLLTD